MANLPNTRRDGIPYRLSKQNVVSPKEHSLSDTIQEYISGDWGEENDADNTLSKVLCIRGADINDVNNGKFDAIPIRYIAKGILDRKRLPLNCIVIEKSGGAPTQSTGRVAFVSEECKKVNKNIVCSNFCVAFSVKSEWDARYVFYYLQYMYTLGVFFNFEGKTSGIRNLQVEQAFASIPIKYIPLSDQRRIASILSNIDHKITLNRRINQNLEA